MILAGGLGTRLSGTVKDLPKPMAPVAGRPFLEHQMDYWILQGANRFILSVGYRHEAIIKHFGASYRGIEIEYSTESNPIGTGGGALLASACLRESGPFFLLNGDTFGNFDSRLIRQRHAASGADITIALVRMAAGGRYSNVQINECGQVLAFHATERKPAPTLVNAGAYFLESHTLIELGWKPGERFSLEADGFPRMLENGVKVHAVEAVTRFLDIGIPDDYFRADNFINQLRQS